jgi:small subunit ribosomal protein S2
MKLLNNLFNNFTYKKLLINMVHIGHKIQKLKYFLKPYMYCVRNGYYILNVKYTILGLKFSINYLFKLTLKRGTVSIINNLYSYFDFSLLKYGSTKCIFFFKRWIGGLFTNIKKMRFLNRLNIRKMPNGYFLTVLKKLPSSIIILNLNSNSNLMLLNECIKLRIPVISIVDSNISSWGIDYPIYGNDESILSVNLYNKLYSKTINVSKLKECLNLKKNCYLLNCLFKKKRNIFSTFKKFISPYNVYIYYFSLRIYILNSFRILKYKLKCRKRLQRRIRRNLRYVRKSRRARKKRRKFLVKKRVYNKLKRKNLFIILNNKFNLLLNLFFSKYKLTKSYFSKNTKGLLLDFIQYIKLLYKLNCKFNFFLLKTFKFILFKRVVLHYTSFLKQNLYNKISAIGLEPIILKGSKF